MDVLNTTMTALRGRINIDSTAGQGTRVSLHIPVSLSFLDCIVVAADGCLYAVPIDAIEEIRHPDPADLMPVVGGGEVLRGRDSLIPLRRLERFYGRHRRTPSPAGRQVTVVLVTSRGPVAVPVDRVIDRQTVVMKPLSGPLAQVRAGFGAALLGTGEVALVLDAEALAEGDAA